MPDFLHCLGFDTSKPKALEDLVATFSDSLTAQPGPDWKYLRWTNKQGIEFWLGTLADGSWLSFNPHFRSACLQTVTLTERFALPNSVLDGVFKCQVSLQRPSRVRDLTVEKDAERPGLDSYSLLFRPPNYHWYDGIALPAEATIQLIAFPDEVQLFPHNAKVIPASRHRPEAPRNFLVPIGAFAQERENKLFPLLELGGSIQALTSFINPRTQRLIYLARVSTIGLELDVLIPADMVPSPPMTGMAIHLKCWLSGRIKEVLPARTDGVDNPNWLFLQGETIAGTYYQDISASLPGMLFWDEIRLVREKDNSFDPQAVACYTLGGDKLGYIPRARNRQIASALDQGIPVQARLSSKSAHANSTTLRVRIYISRPLAA